ncbi:MAG: DUF1700 domain-containing protein, partial [Rectinemataceae bacterium]
MTKANYLSALASALNGMDERSKSEILLELDGHIDELKERNPDKAEEAIVAELDPPEALAAALFEEAGIPRGKADKHHFKVRINIDDDDVDDDDEDDD